MSEFQSVPLEELRESKANPRTHFDPKGLEELAQSILSHGVLTPLLVRPSNGHFEIAAGHRRFRAAKAAGLAEVPAVVREMSDVELLEILVVENNQREDVHPIEEGRGYYALLKAGYTVERLAERVARSRAYVYDRLRLLELAKEAQELFFDGKIDFGHARLLSRLSGADQLRAIGSQEKAPKNEYQRPSGGLFIYERVLGDDEDHVKSVSVRELADWIDRNVRLDPSQPDVPELFPDTARAIEEAEKVVPITREHVIPPDARGAERVLTYRSWKRADGAPVEDLYGGRAKKSKTCEVSVLGVVVIGPGRSEAFRVCVDRLCETHWGAEQREKAKRAKSPDGGAKKRAAEEQRYKAQQAREEAERVAWRKAEPALLAALAEGVATVPGLGKISALVLEYALAPLSGPERTKIKKAAPAGTAAEGALRRICFAVLGRLVFDDWRGRRELPRMAKPFGVDVTKILKEHAPAEPKKAAKS